MIDAESQWRVVGLCTVALGAVAALYTLLASPGPVALGLEAAFMAAGAVATWRMPARLATTSPYYRLLAELDAAMTDVER